MLQASDHEREAFDKGSAAHMDEGRPLSFAQERLWFLEQLEPGTSLYNSSIAYRVSGALSIDAIRLAVLGTLTRHEVLRSTFVSEAGVPRQVVRSAPPDCHTIIDLSSVGRESLEQVLATRLREEASVPFDLANDIMLRTTIFRMAVDEHVLLFSMHHIATDGWSNHLLIEEIAESYNAIQRGESPTLDPLPMQYADYATRQREQLEGDLELRELDYWKTQLEDVPAQLDLPLDRRRPMQPSYSGRRLIAEMPTATADRLDIVAGRTKATPFMALLSALFILLQRYSQQDDLSVGIPIAGRLDPDTEGLIGFFVNMLVIREQLSPQATFTELLAAVRNTCLDAYEHQQLPFERLVALLQPERVRNRTPYFQVSLTFQPRVDVAPTFEGLTISRLEIDNPDAKFDLSITIRRRNGTYAFSVIYPTQLFDEQTIRRFLDQYIHLCGWVSTHPDECLQDAEIAEREASVLELQKLNAGAERASYPASIAEAFHRIASENSDSIALEHGERRLSYQELDQRSDKLCSTLVNQELKPGEIVGVYLEPSFEAIVSYLAILKAQGCYLPLDVSIPLHRTAQLLAEAGTTRVITSSDLGATFDIESVTLTLVDAPDAASSITAPGATTAWRQLGPEDAAYVIFTSGSTGQPKGVRVPHRGVLRLVVEPDYVELDNRTRLVHLASPSFDAATFEIWGPLLNGGTCILPGESLPSVSELGNLLRAHDVNTLWLTSTWFNAIVDEDVAVLQPIRKLLVGGEALSVPHIHQAVNALPQSQLINGYGPTENTTFTCCYQIPRTLDRRAASVPIGRPIRGTTALVLDSQLRPVAPGEPGELFIGGLGLALEYLNDPQLTADRFIAHPLNPDSGKLAYRSGDRVRQLPSGDLEYLGRMDRQLKIRGFRIEPGEIEAVLSQHAAVQDVHVMLSSIIEGGPAHLIAYVIVETGHEFDGEQLLHFLSTRLPSYMIPSFLEQIDGFPRTSSGKIDEHALPDVTRKLSATQEAVLPRSETEHRLASIWANLLQLKTTSIRSNFFELGGHSLLAVRLIAQAESAFRVSLPLSMLFDAPTIEAMAKRIEAIGPGIQRSTVIPLRAGGTGPRFFCIPPAGASVYHFSSLVQRMSEEISFYGIQPLGLEAGEKPQQTVEEMARRYTSDLLAVQSHGPFRLGGRCFGAFVAFEMAQQLVAAGHEVSLLALMDPSAPPGISRDARYYAQRVSYFRRRGKLLPAILRYLRARVIEFRNLWVRGLLANAPARRLAKEQRVHRRAQDNYRPIPYPGTITFLGAEADYHPEDTRALWQQLTTDKFDLHLLPGDHRTITQDPNLRTFADRLSQIIQRADEAARTEDPSEST